MHCVYMLRGASGRHYIGGQMEGRSPHRPQAIATPQARAAAGAFARTVRRPSLQQLLENTKFKALYYLDGFVSIGDSTA